MTQVPRPTTSSGVVTGLVALPALATILWIAAVEGYGVVRPDSSLFVAPPPESLAEAIRHDDVEAVFAIVRSGQDPNRPITVADDELTGGRTVRVSPLLYAVAQQSANSVRMLLGFGARPEVAPDVSAACLAEAMRDRETAQVLRTAVPAIAAHRCAPALADELHPLLAITSTGRR